MLRKPHYIILVLIVVLVVVLIKLPSGAMGRVKLAISSLFLPLFGLTGSIHQFSDQARDSVLSKKQLARQNDDLRQENEELRVRLEQEDSILRENTRLRSLVAWPAQSRWHVRLARVIARDPANWWRTLEIDLGSRDGVKPNAPVLTSEGLVGRVQNVGQSRAQVVLLGNPDLRVAALVNGQTGVINAGTSNPTQNNMVDLDYLSGSSGVHPGEDVVTWGEGGIFPANIPIGKVVDLHSEEFGLTTEVRVKLNADLGALQEVWVMMP